MSEDSKSLPANETSPPPKEIEKPVSTKKSSKRGIFLWIICVFNLICLLTAAGAAYWLYFEHFDEQNTLADQVQTLEQNLSDTLNNNQKTHSLINQQLKIVTDQQARNVKDFTSLKNTMDELSELTQLSNRKIAELSARRPSDWLLAEANYLVNLAGRKLYLEQDVQTSLVLLQEADKRLKELQDSSLLPVRSLLAEDIQNLSSIEIVSTTDIALKLNALARAAKLLPLNVLQLPTTEPEQDLAISDNPADWRQNLHNTWRRFVGDFITIKRVDAPLEPYLAERQQWLIREQLNHTLSQVQSAVLSQQYELFASLLENAKLILQTHYIVEDDQVVATINDIDSLMSLSFSTDMPESLLAQQSLQDTINERVNRFQLSTESDATESNAVEEESN